MGSLFCNRVVKAQQGSCCRTLSNPDLEGARGVNAGGPAMDLSEWWQQGKDSEAGESPGGAERSDRVQFRENAAIASASRPEVVVLLGAAPQEEAAPGPTAEEIRGQSVVALRDLSAISEASTVPSLPGSFSDC